MTDFYYWKNLVSGYESPYAVNYSQEAIDWFIENGYLVIKISENDIPLKQKTKVIE